MDNLSVELTSEDIMEATGRHLSRGRSPGSTERLAASSSAAHQIFPRTSDTVLIAPQPPHQLVGPGNGATKRPDESVGLLPRDVTTLTCCPVDI